MSSPEATIDASIAPLFRALANAMCDSVIAHTDELTALDQAIGDADHGSNMKRGFAAIAAKLDALEGMPWPTAVTEMGKTLVMTVGGASGPLFGTFFMRLGGALPSGQLPTRAELARAVHEAIEGVKARGRANVGQKTMLDVLVPVSTCLDGDAPLTRAQLIACAHEAAEATIPLRAEKGRASFLGERSIGHMDPGARSTELIVAALANAWTDAHGQGKPR